MNKRVLLSVIGILLSVSLVVSSVGATLFYISTGRAATFLVAAVDAPAQVKAQADYVCDGVADNVQLQAAINALPADGGKIHAVGNFSLAAGLTPVAGLWLEGERNATVFTMAANSNTSFMSAGAEVDDVRLESFVIDGNKANNASGKGIDGTNLQRLVISNLDIINCKENGIYGKRTALTGWTHSIYYTTVTASEGVGIYYEDWNVTVAFFRVVAEQGSSDGIKLKNVANPNLLYVDVGANAGIGLNIETAVTPHVYNIHSEGNGDSGQRYYDADYGQFSNLFSQTDSQTNLTGYQIQFEESQRITVNNIFINNSGNNRTGLYIWQSNNSEFIGGYIYMSGAGTTGLYWEATTSRVSGIDINAVTGESRGGGGSNYYLINTAGPIYTNSGTAAVPNGATSIAVNHGLTTTPTIVLVTPYENPTNAVTFWWVDTIGATQFTIHTDADPGASNLDFAWRAVYGAGN